MINENASADDTTTTSERTIDQGPDQGPDQGVEQGAAPPARRRSRRATSAVTTPKRDEPEQGATKADATNADATNADEPKQVEPADDGATKRPARAEKTATKSATKRAAAAGTDDADPTAEADPERRSAGGRRKKAGTATAQAQTSDQTEPQDAESAGTVTGGTDDADRATSKKPAVKKSGPKKSGSKSQPKKASRGEKSGTSSAEADPAGTEKAGTGKSGAEESEGSSKPRLATTALLFQPPEPSRSRRRAQAPAGPPKPDEVEATDEDEESEAAVAAVADSAGQVDSAGQADTGDDDSSPDDDSTEDADSEASDSDDENDGREGAPRRRRRRGGRGRRSRSGSGQGGGGQSEGSGDQAGDGSDGSDAADAREDSAGGDEGSGDESGDGGNGSGEGSSSSRRRRRRRRGSRGDSSDGGGNGSGNGRSRSGRSDEVTALKGSTRLEAKRQRRREGRDAGRRRTVVTESEFLARRESVERSMIVREADGRVQIAVLEDDVLVEHFVSRSGQNGQASMAGNVYLGRVQNVLPSMEAAFIDVGKGRNAVLYAGEVNWDAAGMEGQPRRIEQALKSGDSVLVQVTKDPIGHKGARLTSQITLAGRYLVYVPGGGMTGISRKLPENERARLKKILREVVPDAAGVIVRTAAEGASEDELRNDVQRLQDQWAAIEKKAKTASAPSLLQGEPDLAIRVVRDIFNDDFGSLVVQGDGAWSTISDYVQAMAPDLMAKVSRWETDGDVFAEHRIDEQLAKGMDRKVWLPSGGSLVIDRTEAMTVVDVNTGKFTGSGGTLEETVTRNNLEAAEEIVRQLRLRDIGGIIVIDFIDMVLESNRDLVLRRLIECLGRDRTKHQVAEVTSLGLVQMTRKRVGQGLVEAFSEPCAHCNGRGFIVHSEPVDAKGSSSDDGGSDGQSKRSRRKKPASSSSSSPSSGVPVLPEARESVKATLATIAAAAAHAHEHGVEPEGVEGETLPDAGVVPDPVVPPAEELPDADEAPGVGLPVAADAHPSVPDHAALADLADSLRSVLASREAPGMTTADADGVEDIDAGDAEEDVTEAAAPREGDTLI